MVRNYKRKREKAYSEEDLVVAVQAVNENLMTQLEASEAFKIPRSTLQLHLEGCKWRDSKQQAAARSPTFPEEEEVVIADCLKVMAKWGFGLTRNEVLNTIQAYVQQNQIQTPFTDDRPGEFWFSRFVKKHHLSLRMPELKQSVRFEMFTPEIIFPFYQMWADTLIRYQLTDKPGQVCNLDESAFSHDPSKVKVVGEKGSSLMRRTAGAGRACTTVLACVAADGTRLPPHIIFKSKGETVRAQWKSNNVYPGTTYDVTDGGWMTGDAFLRYMKNVFARLGPKGRPIVILFDGHLSHLSIDVIKFSIENQIGLVKLPAHTTSELQPLDKVLFRPLKLRYNHVLIEWQKKHYGMTVKKADVGELVGEAWCALTEENIKKGFRATGLFDVTKEFPVNPQCVESRFPEASLAAYKERPEYTKLMETCKIVSLQPCAQAHIAEPGPSSLRTSPCCTFESLLLEKITRPAPVSSRADKSSGAHITDVDFLQVLEKKKQNQEVKQQKKLKGRPTKGSTAKKVVKTKKCVGKKVALESSDDDYENESVSELCQDTSDSPLEELEQSETDEDKNEHKFSDGDYIIVKFATKSTCVHYVGRIQHVLDTNGEYQVQFLRKDNDTFSFQYPEVDDISLVQETDIVKKLPRPNSTGGTQRTGLKLKFPRTCFTSALILR